MKPVVRTVRVTACAPSESGMLTQASINVRSSIEATPPVVVGLGLEVNVVARASHRGFAYPFWLRHQGYEFISEEAMTTA